MNLSIDTARGTDRAVIVAVRSAERCAAPRYDWRSDRRRYKLTASEQNTTPTVHAEPPLAAGRAPAQLSGWKCLLIAMLATAVGCGPKPTEPTRPAPTREPPPPAVTEQPAPPIDPIQLQEQAVTELEAGNFATALQLIRRAKRAAPEDPDVIYLMARILAERNRFGEAIKMLDDLAESAPATRLPSLGQTAEWLVHQGSWQEAERRYRLLLDEVDDTTLVDHMLAQLLLRQGRRLEATPHLRKLCRQGNVMESSLRSLLTIAIPFPADATSEEFDPIGALGHARAKISQGNFEEALEWLDPVTANEAKEFSLRGRIYAQQLDFDSLEKWAADPLPDSAESTADYWFAQGVLQAHQGNHRQAVKSFCEVVRRDITDQHAYRAMAGSLEQLDAQDESREALQRAELIQQTHEIGSKLAAGQQNDVRAVTELAELLAELHRPLETLGWRAIQVYYGRMSQSITEETATQAMNEINRDRMQVINDGVASPSQPFILCGVDPEKL